MNMVLLFEKDFIEQDTAVLTDRRHDHIVSILKSKVGDSLKVGLIQGAVGKGLILERDENKTVLKITYDQDPAVKIPVTAIIALPRPPVFRRLVSALTAMGVSKMVFIQTFRVEKSYWNSPSLADENVRQAMVLGLEQACDTVMPEIAFAKRFRPFVEDVLPELAKDRLCLVAHTRDAVACPAGLDKDVVIAVGPEGGFTDDEVGKFCDAGFQPVHLGSRILRVETAVQALIGRMMPI